jgi:hypothetical protein
LEPDDDDDDDDDVPSSASNKNDDSDKISGDELHFVLCRQRTTMSMYLL